jgi:hypothetical protein
MMTPFADISMIHILIVNPEAMAETYLFSSFEITVSRCLTAAP